MVKENKTLQEIVDAVSRVINKTTVLKPVTIYRAVALESIKDYDPARGNFQSWTTNLEYLTEEFKEYGNIILRATLKKGDHAYYDESEQQFVLDHTRKTSTPEFVENLNEFEIFDVDLQFTNPFAFEIKY